MKVFWGAVTLAVLLNGVYAQDELETIDPGTFAANSATVDNPWMPLTPGTQLVYEGTALENGEPVERRIVYTVTDLTKKIHGIDAVVVWDRDFNDGEMIESELVFFAQDQGGTVWHLGQYRETYDELEFVGGRAWMVGHLDGARAGIFMRAEPQLGAPSYSQGFAPAPFNWTDRARVAELGQQTCVPVGCFEDVLVTEEVDAEYPDAAQLKYYAPGVGNIRVGYSGNDPEQEVLELVDIVQLDPAALAEVHAEATELEKRAYVYASTLPAEFRLSEAGGATDSVTD